MQYTSVLTFLLSVFWAMTVQTDLLKANGYIEYIAHASFRFVAKDGSSVVIDPYNSRIWMGYHYPKDIQADAVLITHPHFDHDASYYFKGVPVYNGPGVHQVGSIKVRGVATEHGFADVIRKRGFLPINTAWVIEVDGVRIVHLGDSRKINEQELMNIGSVDMVIGGEEQASASSLNASYTVPNHYRLPTVSETGGQGMPTVDEIIKDKQHVLQLDSNILSLSELKKQDQWIVFQPMDGIEAWSEKLLAAKKEAQLGQRLMMAETPDYKTAQQHMMKAVSLDPEDISHYLLLSSLYTKQGKPVAEIIGILEKGLSMSPYADTGQQYKVRSALGKLYEKTTQPLLAKQHYLWITQQSKAYGVKEYEDATAFLGKSM